MVGVDNAAASYRGMIMCHLVGSSEAELHAMADRIGVARRHFHRGHYNVCKSKRALAVAAGAIEISQREAARIRRQLMEAGHGKRN